MRSSNLPKDSYSHGLRERLAFEVARGSFDQAVRAIETTTRGQVPKRQAEELTAKVSQDFEAFYEDAASSASYWPTLGSLLCPGLHRGRCANILRPAQCGRRRRPARGLTRSPRFRLLDGTC